LSIEAQYEYRTGIGSDIHKLVAGRKLMLGGVYVPHSLGLAGHSDGDVALHAVIDAILGAAAMGDIGTHFPDTDPELEDINSKELLLVIKEKIAQKRWEVVNVDLIIQAEQPKLGQLKGQMKRCIAGLLGIDFAVVNVKAKTNEGIGEIGTGRAIAATSTVLLRRQVKRIL
jgi:2-C-methyl-D-erythritol 2,4-cyclodiphosphate synthase